MARFLFVDFPLGNPCGKPYDADMQGEIVGMALELLEQAFAPQTTVQAPVSWGNDEWRRNFMEVTPEKRAELAAAGEARRRRQAAERTRHG